MTVLLVLQMVDHCLKPLNLKCEVDTRVLALVEFDVQPPHVEALFLGLCVLAFQKLSERVHSLLDAFNASVRKMRLVLLRLNLVVAKVTEEDFALKSTRLAIGQVSNEDSFESLEFLLTNIANFDDEHTIGLDTNGFLELIACGVNLAWYCLLPDESIIVLGDLVFLFGQMLHIDDDSELVLVLDRSESDKASF